MYSTFSLFIHVSGHFGRFHAVTIVNNAAVNMGVSPQHNVFVSLGYSPWNEIAKSCW